MPEPLAPPQPTHVQDPPRTFGGTLRRLGPGMVLAGSIVGSGELIATTRTGAQAGFTLLWLILIGCAIKIFVQVEIGRYTVTWSRTALDALNSLPGPRLRVNWAVWAWAIMTILVLTQQGGIAGGVGQALAISIPITAHGHEYNERHNALIAARVELAIATRQDDGDRKQELAARVDELQSQVAPLREPVDSYLWATLIALATSAMLYIGRYAFIEAAAMILVAGFTAITLLTLLLLQSNPSWAVTGSELADGLSFDLPPATPTSRPIGTALAAFGLIGVGAAELVMYPYWCMEKGYARFTGLRDGSRQWLERARGWIRVMQLDAWGSMIVYTFATAGFYLLGAAVLGRAGLVPGDDAQMIRTLTQMYVPVFGAWAGMIFLIGAIAVLYSTLFVAAAGNARMVADGLGLMGAVGRDDASRLRWTRIISAAWPLVAVALLWLVKQPVAMVLASGVAQALMLPILGFAALYFRYRRSDANLRPGRLWDAMLWLSVAGFFVVGIWTILTRLGLV
jgi:Mn2+/Fe2+ NRAMP family transporter